MKKFYNLSDNRNVSFNYKMIKFTKFFSIISLILIAVIVWTVLLSGCTQASADTVVYGTIYTSNNNQDVVEAAAIKDGKYVYVGDKEGASQYIGEKTDVIEQNNGMVMASGTEAHGHYINQSVENFMLKTKAESFDQLKNELQTYIKQNPNKSIYAGAGFERDNDLAPNTSIDYAKQLDVICVDKPIVVFDSDHHQIITNTKAMTDAFSKMGVNFTDKEKGQEDSTSYPGGIILRLSDGTANGYLRDQAAFYLAYVVLDGIVNDDEYKEAIQDMQETLYKQGYTNYLDALTNVWGDRAITALIDADNDGRLKVNVSPYYESFVADTKDDDSINALIDRAYTFHKQATKHVLPTGVKIFVDGVTESATGLNDIPYVGTNNYGNEVNTEEKIYKVTKAANSKGMPVHAHTYGNVANQHTINAFIKAQNEVNNGTKNTMGHVRNLFAEDYKRIADNNIAVAENINWGTTMTDNLAEINEQTTGVPKSLQADAYPIKSLVDNGIVTGSSTDAPSANDCPTSVFGILEIAVDRTALSWIDGLPQSKQDALRAAGFVDGQIKAEDVINKGENVDVKTGIDIMTIGGAKLIGLGDTCGSIEVGKNADFILVDKNVLTCPTKDIHSAKATEVYFEGEKVFEQ